MSNLLERTHAWLGHITGAEKILLPQSVFASQSLLKMLDTDSLTENPSRAAAVGDYKAQAAKASTPGTAPQSVFDGMQTAVNMCRTKAGYNPLDPEGNGDKAHFIQFTQYISSMPFVTLDWATTTQIKQQSRNADVLINSFVDGFWGIEKGDKDQIVTSVQGLVSAALSYANQTEKLSNFAQNLLQVDSSGNVQFSLYSSTFQISATEKKGIITFHSEYELSQAMYSLSPANWETVKEAFAQQYKVTVDDWINDMTTPAKAGSTVKALCLEER
ncbi:hypothetical protein VYH29_000867 [Vibrio fluvialis]|nr:hypothetical protein [Vibrio fluvialis]